MAERRAACEAGPEFERGCWASALMSSGSSLKLEMGGERAGGKGVDAVASGARGDGLEVCDLAGLGVVEVDVVDLGLDVDAPGEQAVMFESSEQVGQELDDHGVIARTG